MENKKGNGLVVFLIILVLALTIGLTLLLTGFIKSPFIEEKKCDVKENTAETKKEEPKIVETRYYQYIDKRHVQEKFSDGTPAYWYTEIELNDDGTAKINYLRVNDSSPKTGIYVENDKYVILALNNDKCVDENNLPQIADSCTDTIIFIKENGTLKTKRGSLFHFDIANSEYIQEFVEVKKTDLQTALKD